RMAVLGPEDFPTSVERQAASRAAWLGGCQSLAGASDLQGTVRQVHLTAKSHRFSSTADAGVEVGEERANPLGVGYTQGMTRARICLLLLDPFVLRMPRPSRRASAAACAHETSGCSVRLAGRLWWIALLAGLPTGAPAMTCLARPTAELWGHASSVVEGQVLQVGPRTELMWSHWAVVRLKVDRVHKGPTSDVLNLLMDSSFEPGERVLAFARQLDNHERLHYTRERHEARRVKELQVQMDALDPDILGFERYEARLDALIRAGRQRVRVHQVDPDIPYLAAEGSCEQSLYSLDQQPDQGLRRLRDIAQLPPPGSGGALSLTMNADELNKLRKHPVKNTLVSQVARLTGAGKSWSSKLQLGKAPDRAGLEWSWHLPALPAGRYKLEMPTPEGHRLRCDLPQSRSCTSIEISDRGRVTQQLRFEGAAQVRFALRSKSGAAADEYFGLCMRGLDGASPAEWQQVQDGGDEGIWLRPGRYQFLALDGQEKCSEVALEAATWRKRVITRTVRVGFQSLWLKTAERPQRLSAEPCARPAQAPARPSSQAGSPD
ncbi:MAG: hypothetical protein U1E77_21625, partial [Inhella sp.]